MYVKVKETYFRKRITLGPIQNGVYFKCLNKKGRKTAENKQNCYRQLFLHFIFNQST